MLHDSVSDTLIPLFDYQNDEILSERVCPDQSINTYGLKLIQLCIESGLRIMNGRHSTYSKDFTYCGSIDKGGSHKPWFDGTCTNLYKTYRKSLYDFNVRDFRSRDFKCRHDRKT